MSHVSNPAMARRFRPLRRLAQLLALLLLGGLAQPAWLWGRAAWRDSQAEPFLPPAEGLTDSGRGPAVPVARVWQAPAEMQAAIPGLRDQLAEAARRAWPVRVVGARHSQGGQALAPGGLHIDLSALREVRVAADRRHAWIGAGARWSDILAALDPQGLSVKVMQSNHDFSLGGSLSVNAHGWQPGAPPVGSTVRALRIMGADGVVREATRVSNPEWFRHALGGYGLVGVLLEAELELAPNRRVRGVRESVPAEDYPARYAERLRERPDTELAYGRLSVVPGNFLREALLTRYLPEAGEPAPLTAVGEAPFARAVYRAQIGSDAGKWWRWRLESWVGESETSRATSRNQLLNEPSSVFRERGADRVDLLQEYFVPAASFAAFLAAVRERIPGGPADLMNVTVREVRRDTDTALPYATTDVFGLVMLFNLPRTETAYRDLDQRAARLTEACVAAGGRPYLCYRVPADPTLQRRAYPEAEAFLRVKHRLDPDNRFRSAWSERFAACAP